MKNIAKIAAVSAILSVGNIGAKNIERTDAMHCVSTDLQNLAKNIIRTDAINRVSTATATKTADFTKSRENMETEPTPAEQAKKLVNDLAALEDYKAMDEYLAKNGENISKEVLKLALVEAENQKNIAGGKASDAEKERAESVMYGRSDADVEADEAEWKKQSHKITIIDRAITHLQKLLEKKSIPTAEDFAEKPSTIDQKSPAIVKWEKKYEMEIVVNDEYQAVVVMHNGDVVSALSDVNKEKPAEINITNNGRLVFIYADNEKDDNMVVFIPENGGMTQKSGSFNDQLYKFDKTTLAQN